MNRTISRGVMTVDEILQMDSAFRYMLLARLQSDCEYYLNYGNGNVKRLWAGDEKRQIELMVRLHDSFDEKPEWLTMEEIMEYENKIITAKGL